MICRPKAPEYLTEEIDRKLAAIKVKWNRAKLCGHTKAAKDLMDSYEWALMERSGIIAMHYAEQHPHCNVSSRGASYDNRWWS